MGGRLDFLLGQSLGALAPDQQAKHENVKLYLSNFTGNYMMTGCKMSEEDNPNMVNIKRFCSIEDVSRELLKICEDESFTRSDMINKLEVDQRKQAEEDINERIVLDKEAGTVTASYEVPHQSGCCRTRTEDGG